MITLVIAVIGLVGTVAAGSAVSEWLARRSLPEQIKGDLAVWSELPDSVAKERLLARIEERVERLGVDSTPRWRGKLLVFFPPTIVYVAAIFAVTVINGGYYFQRGTDGILRWFHPDGSSVAFQNFVSGIVVTYVIAAFLWPLIDRALKRGGLKEEFNAWFRRPPNSPADQKD